MSRILITSGPTRQYLDPVRYLTNASSGRMGRALAEAALQHGHEVIVVSGPVALTYPPRARVIPVVTTDEMLQACQAEFSSCDGMIGVAAPCDYRPAQVEPQKMHKAGVPRPLTLLETPDIVATLALTKGTRWVVGFALDTEDHRFRALAKLEQKRCDLMVMNEPTAIDAECTSAVVIDPEGQVLESASGTKEVVADAIFVVINQYLIGPRGQ